MSLTRRRASSVARRQGGADEVDERTADKMMDDLLADMGPSPGQGEGNGPGVRSVRDLSGLHELDGLQCQSHKQEPLKPDLAARCLVGCLHGHEGTCEDGHVGAVLDDASEASLSRAMASA